MRTNVRKLDLELVLAGVATIVSLAYMTVITLDRLSPMEVVISLLGGALGVGLVLGAVYLLTRRTRTIFLSHTAADAAVATRIAADLRGRGIRVILPEEEIAPGDRIASKVAAAIGRSDSVVVLMSRDAAASQWVQRELQVARDQSRRIIPVIVGDVEVPESLKDIRYLRLDSYDDTLNQLSKPVSPRV